MGTRVKIKTLHVSFLYHKSGGEEEVVKFSKLFCVLRYFKFLAGKRSVQVFLVGRTAFY